MAIRSWTRLAAACAFCALAASAGRAQETDAGPAELPDIDVIGVTPLAGAGLPIDKVPYNVQAAEPGAFETEGSLTLYDFVERSFAGASAVDLQNNPYQRNFNYRGFVAGPLLGESVGIAAFQNGVRINDPFGDVVQSDLFPEMAIRGIELGNANPAFGFNALGGALVLLTHDGATFQGAELSQSGGSFGRLRTTARAGVDSGDFNLFAAYQHDREDGWRDASPSQLDRFFAAGGADGENGSVRVNLSWASTDLIGNGLAPIELYDIRPESIFTNPDRTQNRNVLISARGEAWIAENVAIQANAYYRRLNRDTLNGDEIDAGACEDDDNEGYICGEAEEDDDDDDANGDETVMRDDDNDRDNDDGDGNGGGNGRANGGDDDDDEEEDEEEFVFYDRSGNPIPAIPLTGDMNVYGALNTSETESTAYGASVQALIETPLGGMDNQFVFGAGVDMGETEFRNAQELGELRFGDRAVIPRSDGMSGLYVAARPEDGDNGNGEADNDEDEGVCVERGGEELCRVDTAPVNLLAENKYYRVYASDTLDLGRGLSVTGSVAANIAKIILKDRSVFLGEPQDRLTGSHDYTAINPGIGAAWSMPGSDVTLFGGYRQSNRAPSPAELSCADENDPCNLPNAFVADPPLDQVISRTFEAGARGSIPRGGMGGLTSIDWTVSAFRATNSDDIVFLTKRPETGGGISSGFFQNVSETRRQGVEVKLRGDAGPVKWRVNYGYVDATFQSSFTVFAENHPRADRGGIEVRPGDKIPGVPEHSLNLGIDTEPFDGLRIGPSMIYRSGVYYRGDEANLASPTDGYTVVNLDASYRITDWIEAFGRVENLFDRKYRTFGIFGEAAEMEDGELEVEAPIHELKHQDNAVLDPRFISPGQPLAAFVGVRLRLN